MKTIAMLISCGFISTCCFAQLDAALGVASKSVPQLVTNPLLESNSTITANMQSEMAATTARMEAENLELKQALQLATWANNLITVQKLINLIENIICFSSNLNVKMGLNSSNCLYQFHWNMQIVKLNCAIDQLSLTIANGIQMTTGERLSGIDRAVRQFHEAQSGLQNLNGMLDRRLMEKARIAQSTQTRKYLVTLRR